MSRSLGRFEGHSGVQEHRGHFRVAPEEFQLTIAGVRLKGKCKGPSRGVCYSVSVLLPGVLARLRPRHNQ
eukprot:5623531-Lingulodinium_polyedra.AAC.1